jgi:protein tyrosine phosphatase/Ca2+-binding EF-hand superfamily protein
MGNADSKQQDDKVPSWHQNGANRKVPIPNNEDGAVDPAMVDQLGQHDLDEFWNRTGSQHAGGGGAAGAARGAQGWAHESGSTNVGGEFGTPAAMVAEMGGTGGGFGSPAALIAEASNAPSGNGLRAAPPLDFTQDPSGGFGKRSDQKKARFLADLMAGMSGYVSTLKANRGIGFKAAYANVQGTGMDQPTDVATLDVNTSKNRYAQIIPFDHKRVVLDDGQEGDYINASWVSGFHNTQRYIVAQGPISNTVIDFWRMIWQEKVDVVVKLTKEVENGEEKSLRYWPDPNEEPATKDMKFVNGGWHFSITHISTERHESYTIRMFDVQCNEEMKTITQFCYDTWPDGRVPVTVHEFIHFRETVKMASDRTASPILLHCSGGNGRSGTYAVIDRVLDAVEKGIKSKDLNIDFTIRSTLLCRLFMVQTETQYEFCFEAVLDGVRSCLRKIKRASVKGSKRKGSKHAAAAAVGAAGSGWATWLPDGVTVAEGHDGDELERAVMAALEPVPRDWMGSLDALGQITTAVASPKSKPKAIQPPKHVPTIAEHSCKAMIVTEANLSNSIDFLISCKEQFQRLDANNNGTLEGKELTELVEWVWTSFHPAGKQVSKSEKMSLQKSIMSVTDANGDGVMDFEEFTEYFKTTTAAIEAFRAGGGTSITAAAEFVESEDEDQERAESAAFLNVCKAKFDSFDSNNNGTLEGKEITTLVEWVWSSFHPAGKKVSKSEKKSLQKSIMSVTDDNGDGVMDFEEFTEYFKTTTAAIEAFRAGGGTSTTAAAMYVESEEEGDEAEFAAFLKECQAKFDSFDSNNNGTLEGKELTKLVEWAWAAFHPGGKKVSKAEKKSLAKSILSVTDDNGNGMMDFEEFTEYFMKTTAAIEEFRTGRGTPPTAAAAAYMQDGTSKAAEFECEFDCGFDGDQATVEAHESRCTLNPQNQASDEEDYGFNDDEDSEYLADVSMKAAKIFDLFDVDNNGDLSPDELARLFRAMQSSTTAAGTEGDDEDDDDDDAMAAMFEEFAPDAIVEMLAMEIDADGDGELSRDEFIAKAEEEGPLYDMVRTTRFASLFVGAGKRKATDLYKLFDVDGNGDLSLKELVLMMEVMVNVDPKSSVVKELKELDPKLLAEVLRLEFNVGIMDQENQKKTKKKKAKPGGGGAVTLAMFLETCCNRPGIMAELIAFTPLTGKVKGGRPVQRQIKASKARTELDASIAAQLRQQVARAKAAVFDKGSASAKAEMDAKREQRQRNIAVAMRAQDAATAARQNAAALLGSSVAGREKKKMSSAEMFVASYADSKAKEDAARAKFLADGIMVEDESDGLEIAPAVGEQLDPRKGKSKIWLALNPQPLGKMSATDRRKLAEEGSNANESDDDESESQMGFGSDASLSDDDADADDEPIDDADLELDPQLAAQLAANRAMRGGDEKRRAAQLAQTHLISTMTTAEARGKEMHIINARKRQESRAAKKKDVEMMAAAQHRMASELVFDFNFFAAADADGDGMLSLAEALAQGMKKELFHTIDADGNGQITTEEFGSWMRQGGAPAEPKNPKSRSLATTRLKANASAIWSAFHTNPQTGMTSKEQVRMARAVAEVATMLSYKSEIVNMGFSALATVLANQIAAASITAGRPEVELAEFEAACTATDTLLSAIIAEMNLTVLVADPAVRKAAIIFRIFDGDGNGFLDLSELAVMIQMLGNSNPDSVIAVEIGKMNLTVLAGVASLEFDSDGDGKVSQPEFITGCTKSSGTSL